MRDIAIVYGKITGFEKYETGMLGVREKAAKGLLEQAEADETALGKQFPEFRKLRSILHHLAVQCDHAGFHRGALSKPSNDGLIHCDRISRQDTCGDCWNKNRGRKQVDNRNSKCQ